MNLPSGARKTCNFEETVIFMKDYSRVMKKVRNNTLKSGIKKTSTRNLTFPNDVIIQWQGYKDVSAIVPVRPHFIKTFRPWFYLCCFMCM